MHSTHSLLTFLTAFFSRIWKRLHNDRADGLKIDPPRREKKKPKKPSSAPDKNNDDSSDELQRLFHENFARMNGAMPGNMPDGNLMNSMMMGGFVNPAMLNAMSGGVSGGNQQMLAMQQRLAEGNDGKTGEGNSHGEL